MIVPSSVFGANAPSNRVNVAAFGVGGRGTADTGAICQLPDARFVAVCDCYESRREAKRQQWNKLYGGDYVKAYSNPWDVLARKDIDAVVIATPDHWHVPLAMAAVQAGKDCYVEKPLSVAMKWSLRLRDQMRGKDRIFQYGTQQRSDKRFRYACELVRTVSSTSAWRARRDSGPDVTCGKYLFDLPQAIEAGLCGHLTGPPWPAKNLAT
jgi:predicted dehydrogenase